MLRDDWLPATFSKVIHRRREFLRISQEELSHRSGLHRTYISDVERGARNVSLKNMSKLAEALEISPSALMRWTELRNLKELALAAVEPEFALFCDNTGAGYVLLDSSGCIVNINATQLGWLNRPVESLIGSKFSEIVNEPDRSRVAMLLDTVRTGGVTHNFSTSLLDADGEAFAVSINVAAVKDEADEYALTRAAITRAATTTAESGGGSADDKQGQNHLLKSVAEGIPMAAVGISNDGKITFWNFAAQQMFGYSANEAVGKPMTLIVPSEKVQEMDDILSRANHGFGRQQIDVSYQMKNGQMLALSMTCSPIRDSKVVHGIVCFFAPQARASISSAMRAELAVVSALEETTSFSAAVPRILSALAGDDYDFAMLWWVDPENGQLRPFAHDQKGLPPAAVQVLTEGIRFLNNGLPRIVWESREPFWISDVTREPRCRPQLQTNQLGIKTGVWFPITVGREVIGVFELLSRRMLPEDAEALSAYVELGARIGRTILRRGERPRVGDAMTASSKQAIQ